MQRTISVNSREYELLMGALNKTKLSITCLPFACQDEKRNLEQEFDKLIKRLKDDGNESPGGTYINGERQ